MTAPVHFLIQLPLTERDRKRFCVDGLLAAGIGVRVFDLGPFLLPDLAVDRSHYPGVTDIPITLVSDRRDLQSMLATLRRDGGVVVCLIAGRSVTRAAAAILRQLGRIGIPYVQFLNVAVPGETIGAALPPSGHLRRLVQFLRNGNLIESVLARLPLRLRGIPFAAAAIIGGRRSRGGALVGPETHTIPAHAFDWEVLREPGTTPADGKATAVFLDQFLPFHPDLAAMGARPLAPEPYYAGLRRLFDRIEGELGLDVVVAAHPRADYDRRPGDFFGARRLVKGDTLALLRSCRLVIAHHSTAIGLAVALGKPVMLVGGRDIWSVMPVVESMGRGYAKALGRPLHDLDAVAEIDLSAALTVDDAAYGRFVADYLKAEDSPDLPLADIVVRSLCALFPALRPGARQAGPPDALPGGPIASTGLSPDGATG